MKQLQTLYISDIYLSFKLQSYIEYENFPAWVTRDSYIIPPGNISI